MQCLSSPKPPTALKLLRNGFSFGFRPEDNLLSLVSPTPSYYKYIAFVENSEYCTSPVYDSSNQLHSILDMNAYPYNFIGSKSNISHVCLPVTYSMRKLDVQTVLQAYSPD